ncbi:hypothetical protein A2V47_03565 [Candidatus Atribacteria bacterium RBG_19FT_COMBO_35_14]|uniref:N-acetyltransferase domain-containing protein n=1 Tax=Candidatus Sediminicultor quintus TaxID=1797291 RepID=A0A1F5AFL2_9BACT|nr:MAG: hypothetical protein A2V47_03565 [Candidatus Atribacteria bacterium RBG_19FT_COMBO_35_14]
MNNIIIRPFIKEDRKSVRMISYETAFLGEDNKNIFADEEILADVLTNYFTDYEPDSCFVADDGGKVIGYIIGSKDIKRVRKIIIIKILPHLIVESIKRLLLFNKNDVRFLYHVLLSFLKGEFSTPDFSKDYPATLHINIKKDYRGKKIGKGLIEYYLSYIYRQGIRGVHLGAISEGAKNFFLNCGFSILYQSKHSYLRYILKQDTPYYVLGKLLCYNRNLEI